jgi:chromosomal replication initiation ATPase DnaA
MNDNQVFRAIERVICKERGVDPVQLISKSQKRKYAEARFWIWYFAKQNTTLSLCKLSEFYNRDHSTVLNGIKVINNLMAYNGKNTQRDDYHKLIQSQVKWKYFNLDDWGSAVGNFMITNNN